MADDVASISVEVQDNATGQLERIAGGMQKLGAATGQTTKAQESLTGSLGNLGGELDGLTRSFTGLSLSQFGTVAGLVSLGYEAVNAASHLEGVENRARVVYGEAFPEMERRARELAATLHRSDSDVLSYATAFSTVYQNFGFAGKGAQDMSLQLSQLAVDVSSFYRDISDDEAFRILQHALEGNYRGLRQLNIVLKDTDLAKYAFDHRMGDLKDLTEAQKAFVTTQVIMQKLGIVMGDATKHGENLSNQTKRLKADWEDFLEKAGTPLLPVFAKALEGVTDLLEGLAAKISLVKTSLINIGSALKGSVTGQATTDQDGFIVNDYRGSALKPKGFAAGGVVHGPTFAMLGEGGYSEAVIPLPDGRAVPVQVSGQAQPQPAPVKIDIGEVHVHDEADEDRLMDKLARMIQLQQLRSS